MSTLPMSVFTVRQGVVLMVLTDFLVLILTSLTYSTRWVRRRIVRRLVESLTRINLIITNTWTCASYMH